MRRGLVLLVLVLLTAAAVPAGAQVDMDLASEQKEKLQQLANRTRQETASVRRDLFEKRRVLVQMYAGYNLDEKKARETIKTLNNVQDRLLQINHENQVGLRRILDAQQFQKFVGAMGRRGHGPGGRGGPGGPDNPTDIVVPGDMVRQQIERLKLTPDQFERVKRLFRPDGPGGKPPIDRIQDGTMNVRRLYMNYELDEKRVRALLDTLNESQRRMLEANLARQVELRKILSEDQFNALMEDVRRGMRQRSGPGPRRQ